MLKRFWKDERAATAIEYGMIVALLSLAITGALGLTFNAIENMFEFAAGKMDAAAPN